MEKRLPSYEIFHRLGAGGMSQVYLAQRTSDGATVVLKSLHPQYAKNATVIQRFHQEAAVLARLSHPAIVQLYDFFVEDGVPYLVMEYVPGQSLQSILQLTQAPISWAWTYETLSPILEALSYVHRLGIVHRDLKPSNILVLPEGGTKLLDFGIAKVLDSDLNLTQTGAEVGTVLYMAPEQIRGQAVSPQTDLYAMGLLIYECLCGAYPWPYAGKPLYEVYKLLLEAPVPIPSWAPAAWREFFRKALAKRAKDRYPSAEAMLADFATLGEATAPALPSHDRRAEPLENLAPPPHAASPPTTKGRRKLWLISIGVGVGILALVGLFWVWGELLPKSVPPSAPETQPAPLEKAAPPPSTPTPAGSPSDRDSTLWVASPSPPPMPSVPAPRANPPPTARSTPPTSQASGSTHSPSALEEAIRRKMKAFAQRRKANFNREIHWGPFPPLPNPTQGQIKIPFRESYTKKATSSEDTFEDCEEGGIQRITNYYVEISWCTRQAEACLSYKLDLSTGQVEVSEVFECFGGGSEECTPPFLKITSYKERGRCQ